MRRTILTYGIAMAGAAVALQLLQYRYTVRVFSTEIYLVIIALSFTVLGVWAGSRLTATSGKRAFQRNTQAIEYLGITERECEVLELLAEGLSNREIAKRLSSHPTR